MSWRAFVSTNNGTASDVAVFETVTNKNLAAIVLSQPSLTATISPDGTLLYVANTDNDTVNIISSTTGQTVDTLSIGTGAGNFDMIISPDGAFLFLTNFATGTASKADLRTKTSVNLIVESQLGPISCTPDGSKVFIGSFSTGDVIVLAAESWSVLQIIHTGVSSGLVSITPDGKVGYATNLFSDTITVIDVLSLAVRQVIPLPPFSGPYGSWILPDGTTLYVVNLFAKNVTVLDIKSNSITTVIPLPGLTRPFWAAGTPNNSLVYIISDDSNQVVSIDTSTQSIAASFAYNVTAMSQNIVIEADQAPVARFCFSVVRRKCASSVLKPVRYRFNARKSTTRFGTILSYHWDFGDGRSKTTASPVVYHTYKSCHTKRRLVKLTVTNSTGTSTQDSTVYSSRFVSRNGSNQATQTRILRFPRGWVSPWCSFF